MKKKTTKNKKRKTMKLAIILGAGASASEGAPIQSNLFRDYFKSIKGSNTIMHEMDRELVTFFDLIFGIDVDHDNLDNVEFPTFEEALGILDLAERRKESLKEFDLENIAANSNRIRFIRQYLVLLMAKIIHEKLISSRGYHNTLVEKLKSIDQLKNTVFISTNYDILIDNALISLYPEYSLDYGVDFTNFDKNNSWKRPEKNLIQLYKIHGSLNWLYCPTCNRLTLTPKEKGVIRLLTDFSNSTCKTCESVIVPIIVPPTYFKDMSNIFLSLVWHKSEMSLTDVDHIVFCGYSFPDADIHIKYLIKRIQTNRKKTMRFTVFNQHTGKAQEIINEEKKRYYRFLGKQVNYTDKSFENFVNDPLNYL